MFYIDYYVQSPLPLGYHIDKKPGADELRNTFTKGVLKAAIYPPPTPVHAK